MPINISQNRGGRIWSYFQLMLEKVEKEPMSPSSAVGHMDQLIDISMHEGELMLLS